MNATERDFRRRPFWSATAERVQLALGLVVLAAANASAREISVTSQSAFNAAIAAAQPGDQLILADGVWTDAQLVLDRPGTVSAPLRVRAQTPGGVILNGASRLTFAAPHVHVEGLFFKEGALSNGAIIRFASDHCRLSDSAIVSYNPTNRNTAYYWVFFDGSHNTVDRCLLMDKRHHQPVVGNAITRARHNTFANSHIKDIPPNGGQNGMEIFRIWGYGGNEELGEDGAFFTIEGNLLERADGESSEIISFKSNRNRVVNNTIRSSLGGITFRSANYNTVAGNFILGEGRRGCYGMRVTGRHHVIVNNYIADCDYGIDLYAGVFIDEPLREGGPAPGVQREATPLGRVPNYSWVRYVEVAHNTFVNNRQYDLRIGGTYSANGQRVLLPAACIIAENLILKTSPGPGVTGVIQNTNPPLDRFSFVPNAWFANVIHGGTVEYPPARDGFIERDPQLLKGTDGIYRPVGEQPVVKAGRKVPGARVVPPDAPLRRDAPGVGAEEFAGTPTRSTPLTADDVGPAWIKDRRKAGEVF